MNLNILKVWIFICAIISCGNVRTFILKDKVVPKNMNEYFEKGDLSFLRKERDNILDIVKIIDEKDVISGKSPIEHLAIGNNEQNIEMIFRIINKVVRENNDLEREADIVYHAIESSLKYKSRIMFDKSLLKMEALIAANDIFDERLIKLSNSLEDIYFDSIKSRLTEKECFDFMIYSLNKIKAIHTKEDGSLNEVMIVGVSGFLDNLTKSNLSSDNVFDFWKQSLLKVNEDDKEKIFNLCEVAFKNIFNFGELKALKFGIENLSKNIINEIWLKTDLLIEYVENNEDSLVLLYAIDIFRKELDKDKENNRASRFNLWDFLLREKTIKHLHNSAESTIMSIVDIIFIYIEEPIFIENIQNSFLEKEEIVLGINKLIDMLKDYDVSVAGYNTVRSISKEVKHLLFEDNAYIISRIQSEIEGKEYEKTIVPLDHLLIILSEEIFNKSKKSLSYTSGLNKEESVQFSYVMCIEIIYNYMFKNIKQGYSFVLEQFVEDIQAEEQLSELKKANGYKTYVRSALSRIGKEMLKKEIENLEDEYKKIVVKDKEEKSIRLILENVVVELTKKCMIDTREGKFSELLLEAAKRADNDLLTDLYLDFSYSIENLKLIQEKPWWESKEVSNKFKILRNSRNGDPASDTRKVQGEEFKKKIAKQQPAIGRVLLSEFDSAATDYSKQSRSKKIISEV